MIINRLGLSAGGTRRRARGRGVRAMREEAQMLPTLAEVLALDVMRRGEPRVVAGTDRLGTLVRWVHAI